MSFHSSTQIPPQDSNSRFCPLVRGGVARHMGRSWLRSWRLYKVGKATCHHCHHRQLRHQRRQRRSACSPTCTILAKSIRVNLCAGCCEESEEEAAWSPLWAKTPPLIWPAQPQPSPSTTCLRLRAAAGGPGTPEEAGLLPLAIKSRLLDYEVARGARRANQNSCRALRCRLTVYGTGGWPKLIPSAVHEGVAMLFPSHQALMRYVTACCFCCCSLFVVLCAGLQSLSQPRSC